MASFIGILVNKEMTLKLIRMLEGDRLRVWIKGIESEEYLMKEEEFPMKL